MHPSFLSSRFYPNIWNYDEEPRYLSWDIRDMTAHFVFFNSRISSGMEGASLEFEGFKSLEIANAIRGLKESKRANELMVQMGNQVTEEHEDNMKHLIKRHSSVLVRRGHDQVDLDIALGLLLDQYLYRERFKFNYRSCKQLALHLLRTSEAHKFDRLEKQRQSLIFQRQKLVGDRYHTHQQTLPPTSWPNFPNVEAVYEREPFAAFIASESNEVGELPEELVQSHLAPFLDSWMQAHESDIYARLESPYENLDLAVNVFVCAFCKDDGPRRPASILIGLKDFRSHFKCIDSQFDFQFSVAGRANALALVDLLGMDPKAATVNDLDARDARFLCEACNVSWHPEVLVRQVLTWRECISHVIQLENTDSHRSGTSWALLTAEATECIKRREQPFPNPEHRVWCCNHCPEHYDDATTRTNVPCHAKDEHSIDRPRVNADVIYDRRKLISLNPRKPICVGLEPPEIYQCRSCPDTVNRLWKIDPLKRHIIDK
ncbi:uncharacterized protein LACBIDRAFT_304516 [Laccaria bicolor S238N-H82]|uniref:Predicted protein n=1 Tax=Laccaria bicolor (strain S238N-H82 / ATCC MYA-4686) TaxID=486041 RepID=B0DLT4_LACBS|nr:uncharacterized protein LACBIDRAFT_304516 [Laccaria bicolor S238N-H82]EDR04449.1 predicted protein [Laccaria bicolor S238N-H82]|eukprot:XP_001884968.1 predicted protein [Laccaria bicolor S238N-H82]